MRTPFLSLRLWAAFVFISLVGGCECGTVVVNPDGSVGGANGATGGGQVGGGIGGGTGGSGMGSDAGVGVDPNGANNSRKDSDCDGLTDAEEFGNTYPGGARTNPANPDTDGDGILDGVEAGRVASVDPACHFVPDADPTSRTNPTVTDSDGDGITDGLEDTNHNGRLDPTETNAANPDTDFDGLADGVEDANHNGVVDPGETDPRKKDTDGDFINDGVERTVTHTDPLQADTDHDSCADGAEDLNQNGKLDPGETNPNDPADCGPGNNPDTDGDGIPNSIEDANHNGKVDPGETDPANPDTDGDGLRDGVEDANRNGRVDASETNPLKKDSDCDGLADGPNLAGGVLGEDLNANGLVDLGETDPLRRDTDGDGITDGVERGVTAAILADKTGCPNVPVDLDPTTTTDPTKADTDGDGINDGAEDTNQNGRVDPGELDPNNPNDGSGPAGKVCTVMNLRPVTFKSEGDADVQLGLPAGFTEVASSSVGGLKRGLIGFDPTTKVAFVAWRQAAPTGATTPTQDETALRPVLNGVGALTNVTTQTFTSWDGQPALQSFADMAGAGDVKAQINALANALVGAGAGSLGGTGGANGPFKLQVEYLHRTNTSVVVIAALTPLANWANTPLFTMSDTAGGSAIAQFGDPNAYQCETFQPASGKIDFLVVVDDSGSMAASQQALADAASAMATSLGNSTLDYRLALITTDYHLSNGRANNGVRRGFTRDINQFRAWLTQGSTCAAGVCSGVPTPLPACDSNGADPDGANGGCWVGTSGGGTEGSLGAARKAIDDLSVLPLPAVEVVNRVRADAQVVVILLGDADDQTRDYTRTSTNPALWEPVSDFVTFFTATGAGTKNRLNVKIPVHGIVCPAGANCNNETQANPQRHAQVITATGGVRGAINDRASIQNAIGSIITSSISAAGYRMQKPPIGASVKVAMDAVLNGAACNRDDLPRSRADGFDFDGINRTISFFGACRPTAATSAAAVSYRYWVDTTPNPNGNPPPCSQDASYDPADPDFCRGRLACNAMTNQCECPSNCGSANPPAGFICDTNRQVCDFVCTADCGGTCSTYQQCNTATCGCDCRQTATCPPGFVFQNGAGFCGCACDVPALACGPTYDPNSASCTCVCKPDCGGCPSGQQCNPSTCSCGGGVN
jgi:Bacterial TSP3 repeat